MRESFEKNIWCWKRMENYERKKNEDQTADNRFNSM